MSSIALGGSGRKWYAAKLVCFLIFSFFFFCHLPLLQPSLCTRTLPSLLIDATAFSLEGLPGPTNLTMMTLTCPHPTLSQHLHMPHHHSPHGPLSHTPCCCPPCGCTLTICLYIFIYLFLTNFL